MRCRLLHLTLSPLVALTSTLRSSRICAPANTRKSNPARLKLVALQASLICLLTLTSFVQAQPSSQSGFRAPKKFEDNRLLGGSRLILLNLTEGKQKVISAVILPVTSVTQLADSNFWQQYKWRFGAVAIVVILQTLLIAALLLERDRKRKANRSLAESEERYRNVVESQTDLICRYLPDTTLTFVNRAYAS